MRLLLFIKKEEVKKILQMVIDIKEIILQINLMDMVDMFGQMVIFTQVDLSKDYVMVKEFGRRIYLNKFVINIKVNILMIKEMDMAYINGQMVIVTKDNLKTT
jgi:hypothetical protein